jgi:hypothetical protein
MSDCEGLPSITSVLDVNVTYEPITDEIAEMNGFVVWKAGLKPHLPVMSEWTSEYFDRGSWIQGPGIVLNTCSELVNPKRPWFPMMQTIMDDSKRCPFQAGDAFHWDKYHYTTILKNVNARMVGEWKLKTVLSQVGVGHSVKYCVMSKFSFTPV